jgi:predicted amidohydrolase YtcJ
MISGENLPNKYLLLNGHIVTMDDDNSKAEAVAIDNGQIVCVGSLSDMNKFLEQGWPYYDLNEKTVIPGFIDCHSHLDLTGIMQSGYRVDEASTISELIRMIRQLATTIPEGQTILLFGLDETKLKERRVPCKDDLDQASIRHPIILLHYTWHQTFLNSIALKRFQITPKQVGVGSYNGELTGILKDPVAFEVNSAAIKEIPEATIEKRIVQVVEEALRHGLTTIHTMQGAMGLDELTEMMLRLQAKLPIHLLFWEQSNNVERAVKNKLSRIGGCGSMQADGELGSNTAAIFENNTERIVHRGVLNYSQEYWDKLILEAHRNRLQFAAHAEGEAGIEAVLSALEKAQKIYKRVNSRHRIEHMELPTLEQLKRMSQIDVLASMQPAFANVKPQEFRKLLNEYGEKRMRYFNPLKSVRKLGIKLAGGSDSPVTPYDPLWGIHCALNHPVKEERLSVWEALRMFTICAAYSGFEDNWKGTIEERKLADLVVLSTDPFQVKPEEFWQSVKVTAVLVKEKLYRTQNYSGMELKSI